MIDTRVRPLLRGLIKAVGGGLGRAGVTPNALTAMGLSGVGAAAALVVLGRFGAGAGALIPAALADALNGAVAWTGRRTSRWAAYLDSVAERATDAALLGALAWHFREEEPRAAAVAIAALALAFIASYAKARAEALGYRCDVGGAERIERTLLVAGALVIPRAAEPALWVLAVVSFVVAGRRARTVWTQPEVE